MAAIFEGFDEFKIEVEEGIKINGVTAGNGPPILLVHGWPESLRIWRHIAPELTAKYRVIAIDLRGYGDSSKPPSDPQHAAYSKRAMARDCIKVMEALGHKNDKFLLLAHDRGARVGHRLCMDYPDRVHKAIFLDICPTLHMYENTTDQFARIYFHWFLLIQPAPVPETLLRNNARFTILATLGVRGDSTTKPFADEDLEAYIENMADEAGVHAMCEDYRASASIDLEHDREDIANGKKMTVPLRILWGQNGVIAQCFDALKAWKEVATEVSGESVESGHYIPEEIPHVVLEHVHSFF